MEITHASSGDIGTYPNMEITYNGVDYFVCYNEEYHIMADSLLSEQGIIPETPPSVHAFFAHIIGRDTIIEKVSG